MSELKVSKRYAKSFLGLSVEKNSLEEAYRDMQALLSVCHSNRDFRAMLKNPLIHPDKKFSILKKLFESRFGKVSMAFMEIIVKKKREFFLEEIAKEFIAQYKELKGITTAIVVSAVGLDEKLRSEIKNIIKNISKSEVELEEKVDKEIIGGFVLRFGDVQYDSSIARNLNMFRRNFSKNLYEAKLWKK